MNLTFWIGIGIATVIVIGLIIAWWGCCGKRNGREHD